MSKESNLGRSPRRVRVIKETTPRGPEYALYVEELPHILSEEEAGMLLHQLLILLPEVPREAAEDWREAKQRVVKYYKAVDGVVVISHVHLQLIQAGAAKVLGAASLEDCARHPNIDDPVSLKQAEFEAVTQQAMIYCKAKGITMHQLMAELYAERAE